MLFKVVKSDVCIRPLFANLFTNLGPIIRKNRENVVYAVTIQAVVIVNYN